MRLVLVGLPGSGKSTVGRLLARRLGLPFHDSDHVIEQQIGCSIRDFFARAGEVAFRDLEERVIDDLMNLLQGVVATGGGAVLRQANRDRIRSAGTVIYLRSTPEEAFRRIRHDGRRPLLQVDDPLERLRSLHFERDPLYRQAAHLVIETGRPSVPKLVKLILEALESSGEIAPR